MEYIWKSEDYTEGDFNSDSSFLMGYFKAEEGALIYEYDGEYLRLDAWGENSLRVRSTIMCEMPADDWALTEKVKPMSPVIKIDSFSASITNGKIKAVINNIGKLTFYNQKGGILLEEYVRDRKDVLAKTSSSLEITAREFKPIPGGDYELTMRFESEPKEKIFGMGQYQQAFLDVKGAELELAHRNSQASVPFMLSSLGYGFLWNNPSIGRVSFNKNLTTWYAGSTKKLDYWITAGDTPAEIEEAYAEVSGKVPMMPEYGMGFWQCKLRYQTEEEFLDIAREYHKRGIPVSVLVVDYFHWPKQGDFRFDPTYWPDPEAMIKEVNDLGMEVMVSVWPMVDYLSENFEEMKSKGLLTRVDRGVRIDNLYQGNTVQYDTTNPAARRYVWEKCKKNYYDKGVKLFWLDEAEPEYSVYDFDNYRYFLGPNVQIGNIYPVQFARGFYEGMRESGEEKIINLLRCAWAGSQKYGALVWSGDIQSSFASLKNQVCAGLNMSIAGIPWWTTDIGGFFGGDINDPGFRELLIRWFQWGTFLPVMRLHGYRMPYQPKYGTTGGANCRSGAPNEIWCFGEETYEICKYYISLREKLRPYIRGVMEQAHLKGSPVMRPLFYEFPEDNHAWEIEDEYTFGADILVTPVTDPGCRKRPVYLPKGARWTDFWTGEKYEGGQTIDADAPLDRIPLFLRDGSTV